MEQEQEKEIIEITFYESLSDSSLNSIKNILKNSLGFETTLKRIS